MPARSAFTALLGAAALAGGLAGAAPPADAAAPPCAPRAGTLGGHRTISYCGPATATIDVGGTTYRFRGGRCERSRAMGALELNLGTLVRGASGNAGRSFLSLVIAHSPSQSEAFEADAGGRSLIGDSVIAPAASLLGRGTFSGELGAVFTGSWDCHGAIVAGA